MGMRHGKVGYLGCGLLAPKHALCGGPSFVWLGIILSPSKAAFPSPSSAPLYPSPSHSRKKPVLDSWMVGWRTYKRQGQSQVTGTGGETVVEGLDGWRKTHSLWTTCGMGMAARLHAGMARLLLPGRQ